MAKRSDTKTQLLMKGNPKEEAGLFNDEEWTCSVCGRVVAPIFIRSDKDGNPKQYCGDHDPIRKEELMKIQGYSPEMIQEELHPKIRRGRPVGS